MLQIYSIFHLNLAYSSIEEEQRSDVIKRCYWPLLSLAQDYDLPFGIEATGYTLEIISKIDPKWVQTLKHLVTVGPCEFIGSGYAQIIGPLVPAEVNDKNLHIGNAVYKQLLGVHPDVALINEQAYSAGLIRHYLDAGYRAIVMEWDNPFRSHPEWNPEWRYLPQIACGQHGEDIPLIWNHSIAFQKFQRYAHADLELNEYLEYLSAHVAETPRVFSLYGNDVEIFEFRPNRYETEAKLQYGEWQRIETLFKALLAHGRYEFIRPSQVLDLAHVSGAGNKVHLETPTQPIPVKKQGKYNITRWAVTGRDDLGINTTCWRIYETLKEASSGCDEDWRELCYLWSSDFRTHITEKRWNAYCERLRKFEKRSGADRLRPVRTCFEEFAAFGSRSEIPPHVHIEQNQAALTVETDALKVRLNCKRGLAIDALWFKTISDACLCGTLHHGYYDDINWGADYYSGHLVLESSGYRRITDLEPADKLSIHYDHATELVGIRTEIPLICGKLYKTLRIGAIDNQPSIMLDYLMEWSKPMFGSLRLGHITINPDAFSPERLFYATQNGGYELETFRISDLIDHGDAVSFLVSAKQVLGCTGSVIRLGDRKHCLNIAVDRTASALAGMIQYQKVGRSYICRLIWSAREMDDSSKASAHLVEPLKCTLRISSEPGRDVKS